MNTKWNIKLTGLVLVLFIGLLTPLSPTLYTEPANQTVSCTDDGGMCTEDQGDITTAFNATDTNGDSVLLSAGTYVLTNQLTIPTIRILDCQNKANTTIRISTANAIVLQDSAQLKNCTIDATAQQTAIHITGNSTTVTGNNIKGFDDAWAVNNAGNSTIISSNVFSAGTGASHYKGITSSRTGAALTSNTMTGNITKGIELSNGSSVLKLNSMTSGLSKGTSAGEAHTGIIISGGSAAHVLGNTSNHTQGNTINTFNTGISVAAEADSRKHGTINL